jgi:uncharacterized protein YecE (DUF72 family)
MGKVFIGTSGFSYPHWRGVFYPENLPPKGWFSYYVKNFNTVELNVSFYRLPLKEVFENWRKKAGGDFVFAIKGWRMISHIKKLKNCQEEIEKFLGALGGLGRLGKNIILWQLPPSLGFDRGRLGNFLAILPKDWRYAFEFRHQSWGRKETWEILRKHQSAVVFQDYPEWPIFEEVTASFVYLRFHGKESLYSSCYTEKELKSWAEKIKKWQKQGLDVYAYFNNDALGYAIKNAKALERLVQLD